MEFATATSIDSLAEATHNVVEPLSPKNVDGILKSYPLTLVIVPGIFGDFIRVRAFEDIFARESKFRTLYKELAKRAKGKFLKNSNGLSEDLLTLDPSYSSGKVREVPRDLTELVQVGSIDDPQGNVLIRVVLFFTPYASLETLRGLTDRATVFNRRLEKFLELTGRQNLVFVGYSRGTTFALEMLAQAREKKATWLPDVKGLVGLSGVVWGSTLADQTDDPTESISKLFQLTKNCSSHLNSKEPTSVLEKVKISFGNAKLLTSCSAQMGALALKVHPTFGTSFTRFGIRNPLLAPALNIDFMSSSIFLFKALDQIILKNLDVNFTQRAKGLIDAVLLGIEQLRTSERLDWWKSTSLPETLNFLRPKLKKKRLSAGQNKIAKFFSLKN